MFADFRPHLAKTTRVSDTKELESLLHQARGAASLADGDRESARDLYRRAAELDPRSGGESLFQFHLAEKEYQSASGVLTKWGDLIGPKTELLRAVLAAQAYGQAPRSQDLEVLRPGREALWPLLYLGILQHAQGEVATSRATLLRAAWQKNVGRNIAVDILLRSETRRCRVCRVRKPATYLQEGVPLCSWCRKLLESSWLEWLVGWRFRQSAKKKSEKRQAPLVPLLGPNDIVAVLDTEAREKWDHARRIATERGREVVGVGDLGIALFEGAFDRHLFIYPREQTRLLHEARALGEERAEGPEKIGRELAWLLNVAHWQRRLFRGHLQFEDCRQHPIDLMFLRAAYSVCQPGPECFQGSALALVTGFDLSSAQAELFEELLRQRPESLFLHIVLGSHHRRIWRPSPKELEHELWMIRHYPHVWRSYQHWLSVYPHQHRACVDAWSEVVGENLDGPEVLSRAADYFRWEYPRLGLALVDRGRRLDPKHRGWTDEAIECLDRVWDLSYGPVERKALAELALTYLEPALAHPPASHNRLELTSLIARHAFTAGRFSQAAKAANRVLSSVKSESSDNVNELHIAHIVLGMLALREGEIELTKHHLIASVCRSPGLGSCSPLGELTRILWRMGQRELLREYLTLGLSRWYRSDLEPWIEVMETEPGFSSWVKEFAP